MEAGAAQMGKAPGLSQVPPGSQRPPPASVPGAVLNPAGIRAVSALPAGAKGDQPKRDRPPSREGGPSAHRRGDLNPGFRVPSPSPNPPALQSRNRTRPGRAPSLHVQGPPGCPGVSWALGRGVSRTQVGAVQALPPPCCVSPACAGPDSSLCKTPWGRGHLESAPSWGQGESVGGREAAAPAPSLPPLPAALLSPTCHCRLESAGDQ